MKNLIKAKLKLIREEQIQIYDVNDILLDNEHEGYRWVARIYNDIRNLELVNYEMGFTDESIYWDVTFENDMTYRYIEEIESGILTMKVRLKMSGEF